MNKATSKSRQDDDQGYYNFRLQGIAYLNEAREVESGEGDFLACNLGVIVGKSGETKTRYLDCIVVGEKTQELVRCYAEDVEADKKVIINFVANDIDPVIFTYKQGEKKGQQGVSLRTRLFHIESVYVDGELAYKAPSKEEAAEEAPEPRQRARTGNSRGTTAPASTPNTKRGSTRGASQGTEKKPASGSRRF
ncbi:MAG: DUF3577 domain-containing protein [Proteobacteria bacterium]|nr:DUF3577 domain-containing protein [Pseudomonadota bacterium]